MVTVLVIAGVIAAVFCMGVCVTGMAVTTAAFYMLDK